eukprot:TRINITY_DN47562_c0_g2_i5.p1 TRINITY_DN47562_c0_g2~~TRINITY_DN47562_c0_g2_i5.p1  ORF type:complete len:281 (-),score=34.99 TRINITY_DN47562_c0_g2_i5:74-916(-)
MSVAERSDTATALRPPDYEGYSLLCPPAKCEVNPVGSWIIPVTTGVGEYDGDIGFYETINDATNEPAMSTCFPGFYRLPPRRSLSGQDKNSVFHQTVGSTANHIWLITWDYGLRTVFALQEQLLPTAMLNTTAAAERTPEETGGELPRSRLAPECDGHTDTEDEAAYSTDGGVAVLFSGAWRFSAHVAQTIVKHLVRPLLAKVFAVFSGPGRSGGVAERSAFLGVFGARVAAFDWTYDPAPEELRGELNASASFRLYEALGGLVLTPLSGNGTNLHSASL